MNKPNIVIYESEKDGTTTVQIDTHNLPEDKNGPIIRVYLNDSIIYENPKYPYLNKILGD